MTRNLVLIIYIFSATFVNSQPMPWEQGQPYRGNVNDEIKLVPWHKIIESDVSFHWRVERIIDTRIKQNTPLKWPKNPLWNVIKNGLETNSLVAYASDSLTRKLNLEALYMKLNHEVVIPVQYDQDDPYATKDSTVKVQFDWEAVTKYKIMEDWIYDKKESRMYCRICYIAPLFTPYAGGAAVPEQPAFYLKYYDPANIDEKCFRNVAVNNLVYNMKNESHKLSYDNFFEMRMFSSYLIKESNVFDNRFKDMDELKDDPIAIMLRAEKAAEELHMKEMDTWEH